MNLLIAGIFLVVGFINAVPLIGVLAAGRLQTLYGVSLSDPNLLILLQHRAVLFGLLGLFVMGAAFVPSWRFAAAVAALISMLSFIVLAWVHGGHNALIHRVVIVDGVMSIAMLLAAALLMSTRAD